MGLPTPREVTAESVRERLADTLRIIRANLPEDSAEALIHNIERAWR